MSDDEKAEGKGVMQQGDLNQPREFRALTWIVLHGPDGTADGTPVLVNDGPNEFVTGKLGPVAAGRHRFALTAGGQEYSTEQVCEGSTEDKPQQIDVITPSQERDSVHLLVLPPYTWIVVRGLGGTGNGITVDINSGFLQTVTGRPYKIRLANTFSRLSEADRRTALNNNVLKDASKVPIYLIPRTIHT